MRSRVEGRLWVRSTCARSWPPLQLNPSVDTHCPLGHRASNATLPSPIFLHAVLVFTLEFLELAPVTSSRGPSDRSSLGSLRHHCGGWGDEKPSEVCGRGVPLSRL